MSASAWLIIWAACRCSSSSGGMPARWSTHPSSVTLMEYRRGRISTRQRAGGTALGAAADHGTGEEVCRRAGGGGFLEGVVAIGRCDQGQRRGLGAGALGRRGLGDGLLLGGVLVDVI